MPKAVPVAASPVSQISTQVSVSVFFWVIYSKGIGPWDFFVRPRERGNWSCPGSCSKKRPFLRKKWGGGNVHTEVDDDFFVGEVGNVCLREGETEFKVMLYGIYIFIYPWDSSPFFAHHLVGIFFASPLFSMESHLSSSRSRLESQVGSFLGIFTEFMMDFCYLLGQWLNLTLPETNIAHENHHLSW